MSKKSLYERLGGYDAISAVSNDLVDRLQKDPQLVVHRAAGTGAEKIHEELPFPLHAVLAAMLPEPAQGP